jgi:acyl-CoA synthetase (AMP-forming)/AMP-acid ligase II
VLLTEDAYAFAVGLLALWHSGRHAISPPNQQQGALGALESRAAGVLCDRPGWFRTGNPIDPLAAIEDAEGEGSAALFAPLDPDAPAVELYTSGTTGAEKPVVKRIRHLQDEVRELSTLWDDLASDATVFATASHQHLYGMLFGVLWPLCAGRAFQSQHFLHVGELMPRLRATQSWLLAGVPTHLRRFARQMEGEALGRSCRVVFSSGGPLDGETAHRIARGLGRPPLEVLGSSETGGIAWRSQDPIAQESLWTPFPSVEVARDATSGSLRVRSPFVSVDAGGAGFATGDLISLRADGRFTLEGRSTRIVKIGEKRLDLSAMESQLRGHEWIAEVALGAQGQEGDPRVVAIAVPTESGWDQIRLTGRRSFADGLRAALARDWDPVLHPRYWRTARALPENEQGKITLETWKDLFENPESQKFRDRAAVVAEVRRPDCVERSCFVPQDLCCFAGHFPGRPVVPGVLLLDWAMEAASDWLERQLQVVEIESLKLHSPLTPGARFRLRVRTDTAERLEFTIWSERGEHAKGRVRLAPCGGEAS